MLARFNASLQSAAVAVTIAATGFLGTTAQSASVLPGFDLLFTPGPDTFFNGVGFSGRPSAVGSPLCGANQFNFGAGCVSTFQTDAILHRKEEALPPGPSTIELEFIALSLRSDVPFEFFPGTGPEFIDARILKDLSTDTWIYGRDLGSTMTISFNADHTGGTFTSDLHFEVALIGASSGLSVVQTFNLIQKDALWDRTPPGSAVQIAGINLRLNGFDNTNDFWTGTATHCDDLENPSKCHTTVPAPIPVPAALPLLASGFGVLALLRSRRKHA